MYALALSTKKLCLQTFDLRLLVIECHLQTFSFCPLAAASLALGLQKQDYPLLTVSKAERLYNWRERLDIPVTAIEIDIGSSTRNYAIILL